MGSKSAIAMIAFALTGLAIAWRKRSSETLTAGFVAGLLLLDLLTFWVYHAYIFPRFVSRLKDIPIVSGYHFIGGNTFTGKGNGPFACNPSRGWVEEAKTELVRFFDLPHSELVIPVSSAAIQELLATKCYDFQKPPFLKIGSNVAIIGDGLLLAEGEVHKRQRKQLSPAFAFRHIKDLVPQFWQFSAALTRAVEAQRHSDTGKAIIMPNAWTSRATLDIIGQAGMGKNMDALDAPEHGLANAYSKIFELDSPFVNVVRLLEFVVPSELIAMAPYKALKVFQGHVRFIRETCREMIVEKRAAREKSIEGPTVDILSAILSESEIAFSDAQIEEHLLTFLAAGHETTAAAMAWALVVLCKYPDVQRRLREEVWSKLDSEAWDPTSGAAVTAEQLADMPYLQAFCNEVLRVYPPIPMTAREAAVDTTLAGHPIPKGTVVVVAIWGTNTSTALWGPDAAQFRVERWLESPSGGCKSNYALQTFLAGPRSCIGMSFAKHEFQCLVASWVGRLATRYAPGQEEPIPHVLGNISAKPTPGWKIEIEVVERPE